MIAKHSPGMNRGIISNLFSKLLSTLAYRLSREKNTHSYHIKNVNAIQFTIEKRCLDA